MGRWVASVPRSRSRIRRKRRSRSRRVSTSCPPGCPRSSRRRLLDSPLSPGSRVRLKLSSAAAGTEVVGTVRQLRPPSVFVIGGSGWPADGRGPGSLRPGRRVVDAPRPRDRADDVADVRVHRARGRAADQRRDPGLAPALPRDPRRRGRGGAGLVGSARRASRRVRRPGRPPSCSPGSSSSISGLSTRPSGRRRCGSRPSRRPTRSARRSAGSVTTRAVPSRSAWTPRLRCSVEPRVGLEVVDPGPRPPAGHAADDQPPTDVVEDDLDAAGLAGSAAGGGDVDGLAVVQRVVDGGVHVGFGSSG